MEQSDNSWWPSRWRILLAFAIVPGIAAFAMAAVVPAYSGTPSQFERVWRTAIIDALFGAYPSALVFGLPTYAFLSQRVSPTWLNCSLAGAFVAGVPWILLMLLGPAADQASIGGKATVIDGTTTLYGWLLHLQFVGLIALFGSLAGLLFWTILAAGQKVR